MKSSSPRPLRTLAQRSLDRLGYKLVPLPGRGRDERDAPFDKRLQHDPNSLPPDSEEVLRSDNARLRELREMYAAFDAPVTVHSRWGDDNVRSWLNLRYFRGDNIYLWHRRFGERETELMYFVLLQHLRQRDDRSLFESLNEDGLFGCWTFEFPGYPSVSRDLLDSISELLYLDRAVSMFSQKGLRVFEIGAGYGRLAYRASQCVDGLSDYACADAIPESTFLCEYYVNYRGVAPPVRVVTLPEVPQLVSTFDLAVNIHSFSECPLAAIEWWMGQLARLAVPQLFIVPNEPEGFLSTERDGSRHCYRAAIEGAGYRLASDEPVVSDEAVRKLTQIEDRYCLFQRQV